MYVRKAGSVAPSSQLAACQLHNAYLRWTGQFPGVTLVPASVLTTREEQVRSLVVGGLGTDGVAARLGISRRTVETHLRNVYKKLGVHRREDLAQPDADRDFLVGAPASEDEVHQLKEKLAERERQLESYEAAVQRIIDRQFPLFDERVEITVTVGSSSLEDVVTERHWTAPNPYLVYRVVRPIMSWRPGGEAADSLAMTCDVVGADVGVNVQVMADQHNRPLALILFQPGLNRPAEWVLRYRTPGLWDPLRVDGTDRLTWAAGTLDERYADGISELRVHFMFPPGATGIDVSELRGAGRTESAD